MINKQNMKPVYFLNGWSLKLPIVPKQILLLFLAFSFGATGIDVAMAHSQNHFIPWYEWIPVIYSPLAMIITLMYLFYQDRNNVLWVYRITLIFGMVMGIIGMLFHLFGNMTLNEIQPIEWLIIGAPFIAPMAFTGMALFGLAIVNQGPQTLLRLVGLGFLIIALTAAYDHAQTNFINTFTFFPIIAGMLAFMIIWLCTNQGRKGNTKEQINISLPVANLFYAVMLIMIITGTLGFILHVNTNLEYTTRFSWSRMLYNAPVLAPLLFAQLGTLGILTSLTLVKPSNNNDYQSMANIAKY